MCKMFIFMHLCIFNWCYNCFPLPGLLHGVTTEALLEPCLYMTSPGRLIYLLIGDQESWGEIILALLWVDLQGVCCFNKTQIWNDSLVAQWLPIDCFGKHCSNLPKAYCDFSEPPSLICMSPLLSLSLHWPDHPQPGNLQRPDQLADRCQDAGQPKYCHNPVW